jgi:hypothetical protein
MTPPGISSKGPKEYNIPSRSYGITANEAAEIKITAQEIKSNKELNKAALKVLREKKKAINNAI